MSNETEKPMAGALRAARAMLSAEHQNEHHNSLTCGRCRFYAEIIARESGLAEILTLIDKAIRPGSAPGYYDVNLPACMELVAAARRVKEE